MLPSDADTRDVCAINQIQYIEAQRHSRPPETNLLRTPLKFGDSWVRTGSTLSPTADNT